MITVLIPAHNEADQLVATVTSLHQQTHEPDQIIVMSDNSTDSTVSLAQSLGCLAWESQGNSQKKAGALNQALDRLLSAMGPEDRILIMDADCQVDPKFIEVGIKTLNDQPTVAAVGAIFYGDTGGGLLGLLQRNEYTRYGREIARTGRVMVLSGTAAMFRPEPLREVAEARGSTIPGEHGRVYDTLSLTEDNEVTLALKTLGWKLLSPVECTTITEIMPRVQDLHVQRLRWYRGAIDNLRNYGLTRTTALYWYQQGMLAFGVFSLYLYLGLTAFSLAEGNSFRLNWFWLAITSVFMVERVVTVWKGGWVARLVAATLYIELAYDVILQITWMRSVVEAILRREAKWVHVTTQPTTQEVN
jgi:cellulose synthase/poly-beta-1,6-N-acetylglucosamine synthase-like glycosyltransferase